jgi:hypothetical protein
VLTFFCPGLFTSLAFDAGGVASGVMAATFLLPLSIGICTARGASADEIMIDAFGTIALVAMTPTITIQVLGLIYKSKRKHSEAIEAALDDVTVIDMPDGKSAGTDTLPEYDCDIIEFPAVASKSTANVK